MVINAAEKTGYPLVVHTPPAASGPSVFVQSNQTVEFMNLDFEMFKHLDHSPPFEAPPPVYPTESGSAWQAVHTPMPPKTSQLAPTVTPTTKPKSYAEVAATAEAQIAKAHADLAKSQAKLAKLETDAEAQFSDMIGPEAKAKAQFSNLTSHPVSNSKKRSKQLSRFEEAQINFESR
jgi:hypothetical protein